MDYNRNEFTRIKFKPDRFFDEKKNQRRNISMKKKQWRKEHFRLIVIVAGACILLTAGAVLLHPAG